MLYDKRNDFGIDRCKSVLMLVFISSCVFFANILLMCYALLFLMLPALLSVLTVSKQCCSLAFCCTVYVFDLFVCFCTKQCFAHFIIYMYTVDMVEMYTYHFGIKLCLVFHCYYMFTQTVN